MGYIEKNLLAGELVKFKTKNHWITFFNPIFCLIVGLVLLNLAEIAEDQTVKYSVYAISGILILGSFFNVLEVLIKYFTSEYGVTNQRVLIKIGFIKRDTFELLLSKVESFQVKQSIPGRILGYGTILISGTGAGQEEFPIVSKPLELKSQVQQLAKDYESNFLKGPEPARANEQTTTSIADEIKKLSDLVEQGVITQDEFDEQKRKILEQ